MSHEPPLISSFAPPSSSGSGWLLPSGGLNPEMDCVLLLCAVPAPAAAAPLTGMAAARARMLAMQAARRGGAALKANNAAPATLKRSGGLKAALWRAGDDEAENVWDVDVRLDGLWEKQEGEEEVSAKAVEWCRRGQTLVILLSLTRQPPSDPSTSTAPTLERRDFVSLHRVADGTREALVELPGGSDASHVAGLRWVQGSVEPTKPSFESLLTRLPLLHPPVGSASAGGAKSRLMPYQLAAQRAKAGARAGEVAPSELTLNDARGVGGALVRFPRLAQCVKLVKDGEAAVKSQEEQNKLGVLVAWQGRQLHVLLDAQVHLGTIDLATLPAGLEAPVVLSAALTADLCQLEVLLGASPRQASHHAALSLPLRMAEPGCMPGNDKLLSAAHHIATLSTHLHALLAHLLALLSLLKTAYTTLRAHALTWEACCARASEQFVCDAKSDMIVALATGRVSDAIESLLAGGGGGDAGADAAVDLTPGTLDKMRDESLVAADDVASGAGRHVVQTLQRCLLVVEELQGCAKWSERFEALLPTDSDNAKELDACGRLLERLLILAKRTQEAAELERLALDEFYDWWSVEREKQDKVRRAEGEAPSDPRHDTITVSELLRRGFLSADLDVLVLGIFAQPKAETLIEDPDASDDAIAAKRAAPAPAAPTGPAPAPDSALELAPLETAPAQPSLSYALAQARTLLESPRKPLHHIDAPSTEDVSTLYSRPSRLFAGAAHGLAQTLIERPTVSLSTYAETVLKCTSRVMREALARTCNGATLLDVPRPKLTEVQGETAGRADQLINTVSGASTSEDALQVRSVVLQAKTYLTAHVVYAGTAMLLRLTQVALSGSGNTATLDYDMCSDGLSARVLDYSWYGSLVVLLVQEQAACKLLVLRVLEQGSLCKPTLLKSYALKGEETCEQIATNRAKGTLACWKPGKINHLDYLDFEEVEAEAE